MLVAQVKNVEIQGHIAKGELHESITAVDYGIRCGQVWPPKYDGHLVNALCHRLRIKNNEVYRIIKLIHFHQDIIHYSLLDFR